MIKSFLKIAFRNLLKYKIFTFINISGLALGITAVLLISMYVFNELNFENVHQNGDRIYRVNMRFGTGEQPMKFAGAMPALGPAAKSEIPEVKNSVRYLSAKKIKIKFGEKEFEESKFYYADPSIFNVFTFPLIKGNVENPFLNYNSVVIVQSEAEKIFGNQNPLGQILHSENNLDFVVSAIAKDIPANTQLQWKFLAPIGLLEKSKPDFQSWMQFGECYTYLLLDKGVSSVLLDNKLNRLVADNTGQMASYIKVYTQKLTDIYLHSDVVFDISPKGNVTFIYLFSTVAFLILAIATFNFMNLSTVRSIQRSKEVGLKKVLGATRLNLIGQFLSESFLVTFFSVILSLGLYYALSPVLSEFLRYKIAAPAYRDIYFYLSIVGVLLTVTFISGIYPAFILSRYKPIETLRGIDKPMAGKLPIRKALVIFQFALAIVLISGTITVLKQLNFMKNADIGLDKSNVILLDFPASSEGSEGKYQVLKNKFLENPNICGVSGVYTLPGINSEEQQQISLTQSSLQDSKTIRTIGVDLDFIPMMKAKILAGRNFSKEYSTDNNSSIIINESAAKMLSLKNPVGATVYIPEREATIIGVVNDFNIESLHKKIVPYFLYINPKRYFNVAIKINETQPQATLQFIKTAWSEVLPAVEMNYSFFEDSYSHLYSDDEKLAQLFTIFSVLAIIIACLGLLGLSSFTALKRTKEIGIRKVLGANVPRIIYMLSIDYIKWITIAFLIAFPIAYYFLDKWLQDFAYRIDIEWWIFALAGGIAFMVALLTISIQAIKSAMADPVKSLRYE